MRPKQELEQVLPHLSEEVCAMVLGLLKSTCKGDLMRLVYNEEEYREVDSAYPQPYADRIRELNPQFRGHFHVFDYNIASFGALENVAERVVMKFYELRNDSQVF